MSLAPNTLCVQVSPSNIEYNNLHLVIILEANMSPLEFIYDILPEYKVEVGLMTGAKLGRIVVLIKDGISYSRLHDNENDILSTVSLK